MNGWEWMDGWMVHSARGRALSFSLRRHLAGLWNLAAVLFSFLTFHLGRSVGAVDGMGREASTDDRRRLRRHAVGGLR